MAAAYRFRTIFFFFIVFALFIISTDNPCAGFDKTRQASISDIKDINLGIITLYHPLVMYRNYQPFADYLSQKTPYTFTLKISENYYQIIDFLSKGTIQVAILGGMTYLEAKKKVEIIPLLSALGKDGKPLCRGVFITRSDNPRINTIEDIKGTHFAFASIHSTSGNLMPLYFLYSQTDIRLSDFQSYENLKYHDSVIRNVLRGNFEAGVALGTIASQYLNVGLKFIGKTEPFPGFLLVARKDVPEQVLDSMRRSLLTLNYNNPENRKIMDTWDVNIRYGFTPTSDKAYETIAEAVSSLSSYGIEWR